MTEAPGGVLIALALVVLVAPSGAAPTVFAQVPPALAIDVADVLGPAAAIGDLLGVQAGPATVGRREDVDRWVYAAWHALGLRANPITVFEPDGGVRVSLDRTGRPRVNFKALDDAVRYYAGSLETKRPDFSLGPTPQALSSRPRDKHYQHYAPQSYDDWRDVVGQTVKHINTWRAVKTADPKAKLGAPARSRTPRPSTKPRAGRHGDSMSSSPGSPNTTRRIPGAP